MEWNPHHEDIRWFFEPFNIMSGPMVDFIHHECGRKYIVTSEAEWTSLRVYGFLRSRESVIGWSSLTYSAAGHDVQLTQ